MRMGWMFAAVLLLALGAPPAITAPASGASEQLVTMRLEGSLTVAPDGTVEDYRIASKMPDSVKELLDQSIQRWRFEPVLIAGSPVRAQSPMRVIVAASEEGKGYRLRIDNVLFRPNTVEEYEAARASSKAQDGMYIKAERVKPPVYPTPLLAAGIEGIVLLHLRLNADGSVAEVFPVQSSLLNVRGRASDLERSRERLERSALAAAVDWRFKVETDAPERLTSRDLSLAIPVEYTIRAQGDIPGSWRHEFRGPKGTAPWLERGVTDETVGVSDLLNGEMLSGKPTLRLRNRDQALGAP